ncbi:TIR domain-containing protein [Leeuwenhoekiella sp. H156]|uniref:TIR domain-containing protein n=1 Tax=Leeuwenhoekiella sp. H156 TaxID=3450128 RepID=UPI003FA4406A
MKYKAFLSYSHSQDTDLGTSLEKALEKFAKPTFKRRALEIFRDANDLSAAADLGEKIRTGLEESEYFICMACEKYAQSKWCAREAEWWRDHKSIDTFLIVLTQGEILWDESTNDFDWNVTTAIPKVLSGAFNGEPFYVDFRNLGPKEKLTLENPEFKNRVVLLAATLHGKSIGDMVGEAVKQHKRTVRLRNAAISVLSILLVAVIIALFYAVNQKNRALLSSYLANAQAQFTEDPTRSLRLAEYAWNFAQENDFPTAEAGELITKVFYSGYGFYQEQTDDLPDFESMENSAPRVARTPFESRVLQLTDSILNTVPKDNYLSNQSDLYIDSENESAILAVSSNAVGFTQLYFIETADFYINRVHVLLPGFVGFTGYIQDIDISNDGTYTVLGSANGKTAVLDNAFYRSNPDKNRFKDRAILMAEEGYPVRGISLLNDDDLIGVASFGSTYENGYREDLPQTTYYFKTAAFPYIELRNDDSEQGNSSLDSFYYITPDDSQNNDPFTWFHFAQSLHSKDGAVIAQFPDAEGVKLESVESPDGNYFASYKAVFNKHGEQLIALDLDFIDNPGVAICFSTDSKYFKVSYLDGLERIFPLDPQTILKRINKVEIMGNIAHLSPADKVRFLIED